MLINVDSFEQVKTEWIKGAKDGLFGFFADFSEKSKQVEKLFKAMSYEYPEKPFYYVNAVLAGDVNGYFGITSVPCVIKVKNGRIERGVYGPAVKEQYLALLEDSAHNPADLAVKRKEAEVIVYSTPVCSWCIKVKAYLQEKGVKFKDIDVSKNEKAAAELVNKTGQTGVPQLKIGSVYVVGFDKGRIDSLLNL